MKKEKTRDLMEKYTLNLSDWEIISVILTHGCMFQWGHCACSLHVKDREANYGVRTLVAYTEMLLLMTCCLLSKENQGMEF